MTASGVAVTGLGLVTPAGLGVAASWEGLCAGMPMAAKDPKLAGLPVDFSCRLPGFDPVTELGKRLTWRIDLFTEMALVAAREAVADAGLDPTTWDGTRVGVVIGNGSGGNVSLEAEYGKLRDNRISAISPLTIPRSVPNMVAGEIAIDMQALGPNLVTATACASGATALGTARDLLRLDACDIVIAGGSESVCSRIASVGFSQAGALSSRTHDPAGSSRPFDADRDGFVLGEGAGILVLEQTAHARARGARVHAYFSGYGATADGHHPTAPDPAGGGVRRAITAALDDAGLSAADIDHVNAHGTSTEKNDLAEGQVLRTVFGTPPPVTANKSIIGHCVGAAGAIEAAVTVLTLRNQLIPPTANLDRLDPEIDLDIVTKAARPHLMRAALSNSFAFGGQNAVLVFTTA
ncbi:beta-ketoacyl-[acyl-carrier-protein] synthase family protein [Streptomyces sp. NBC_01174]|uniref:beta-ketoacyl-[acyl-carrier-protein] synthase family protein n=1 Tax=Streptomyces sp. NBC_01174 TaxID=2903758 RepID=UPI00386CC652|nr:beta-ketoacyl-[acyl-carrier-protein] synthase family protein [Streptomyces sp. MT29]WSS60432.1 beta-ketoacyl-[acyl-carrier-protein] synthase family protein [Streptomyces sp. NBC_01177]WSS74459.1 beta-ketoacyl-[acyl-carrier-protein] synthase family protein [Streptomyces sp. NBC_01174]